MFEGDPQQFCCRCGVAKGATEFNFKNRAAGRRHPFCRECQHAWNREHYQKARATYIANAKRNNARYDASNLERVVAYLSEHPCVDCGETDLLVLEFDHRDPKSKRASIGELLKNRAGWDRLADEIAMCDVRCANCHRRRTAAQVGWRKLAMKLAGAAGLEPATSDFGDRRSTN